MQASMSGSLGGGRSQTFAQIRPFEKSRTDNNNALHHNNVCHHYGGMRDDIINIDHMRTIVRACVCASVSACVCACVRGACVRVCEQKMFSTDSAQHDIMVALSISGTYL